MNASILTFNSIKTEFVPIELKKYNLLLTQHHPQVLRWKWKSEGDSVMNEEESMQWLNKERSDGCSERRVRDSDTCSLNDLVVVGKDQKQGVDSRDKAKHIEKNDQLYVTRMVWVDEREWPEMKSECCEESEQWWDYADMNWL